MQVDTKHLGLWHVEPSHSSLEFSARHMMVSKVKGTFGDYEAHVDVRTPFEDSTVTAVLRTASIDTRHADRDAHLVNNEFLDVENHPEITFTSTKVTDDTIEGDLTIKGITRPITLDWEFEGISEDPWGATLAGAVARGKFNRKDFDMVWNVAVETGGVLVGDVVTLTLEVELVKDNGAPKE